MLCPYCHKAEQIPQAGPVQKAIGGRVFSLVVPLVVCPECKIGQPSPGTTELFYRELVAWLLAEGIRTPAAARELRILLKVQRDALKASREDVRAWEEGRVPIPARVWAILEARAREFLGATSAIP